MPDARPEPVAPRQAAIEHPAEHHIDRPIAQPITPPAPAPAIKPVESLAKVTALPQPEPAPLPAPVVAAPPPAAPPVIPPQTATSESTKSTQVSESMTKQEPYSSRPQKLTPPNSGTSLTTILIAAGLALTALGTFLWMRRERDPDDLPAGPRVFAGPGFDAGFDNDTRTIPSLSGPMAADGLHRSADAYPPNAYPVGPAFGPYAHHPAEPAFDDPLGPVLPEWPDLPESSGNDRPRLEPAFSEPDPAHDWTAPNHAHSHTLEIPAHDEPRLPEAEPANPAAIETGHLVANPPEPSPPSNWAGSAEWPSEMPQTHDDALHILGMGVTSKASLTAMKKIVDGLRLSWHPDQAADDAERAIRELRIRQINTAWDIIASGHPSHDGDPMI